MNLGIIIPLKSMQVSRNWQTTCNALKRTLLSILNQSDSNYTVVVCGHEKPSFLDEQKFTKIEFLTADFLPPSPKGPDFIHNHYVLDKNRKIVSGLKRFQTNDIQYWYQLDSDDLVHTELVASLQDLKNESGALLESGYMYYPHHKRVLLTDEMSLYCGSTSIIATDLLNLPENVDFNTMKSCPWASWAHMNMRHYYADIKDRDFRVITEPMLVYMRDSGDNISDNYRDNIIKKAKFRLLPYIKGKKISKEIRKVFTFND